MNFNSCNMEKNTSLVVSSPNVKYTDDYIYSDYVYEETLVTKTGNEFLVSTALVFESF